ncbi:MAG: FAD-dependent oxidoreductase [Bryobacteraceae bacterium]
MSNGVAILGAGPAGLGAACQLARRNVAPVTVLEQGENVGGLAGSFELDGVRADYGSHRLQPACDPRILGDLQELLGEDLLLRPRHGRIRLARRWIHFPLRPLDLVMHLPLSFAAGFVADTVGRAVRRRTQPNPTFASVLENGLGPTICRNFYFPYARKIWGLSPELLSPIQAYRRVSSSSPGSLIRKIVRAVPGLRSTRGNRFYYPRWGFGQISAALEKAAASAGAGVILGATVTRIEPAHSRVFYEVAGTEKHLDGRHVWSTLPVSLLVRSIDPPPPAAVLEAAAAMRFRAMVLIYLVLEQDQFTEYDAHYFPEEEIPISRLSEPKNYSAAEAPRGRTVLCAELPCDTASRYWRMADHELTEAVRQSLAAAGLPIRSRIRCTAVRRFAHAYPLYQIGYEEHFNTIDRWLDGFGNLLTFGRQGLFAHDNTHHALAMAYAAADCLDGGGDFDWERWRNYRRGFESHVVED